MLRGVLVLRQYAVTEASMCRKGFALLLVLLVVSSVLSTMALLAQGVALHQHGEVQRQAWHRARLLASGAVSLAQYQIAQGQAAQVAALSLPSDTIAEADISRYQAKLKAPSVSGINLASDEKILVGYDAQSKQVLGYGEINQNGRVLSRIWLKQKI